MLQLHKQCKKRIDKYCVTFKNLFFSVIKKGYLIIILPRIMAQQSLDYLNHYNQKIVFTFMW